MFKSIVTLFRGTVYDMAEAVEDHNVFVILDQQLRDCTRAVDQARKALAMAMAQKEKERAHLTKINALIAGLEVRARDDLEAGEEVLAAEAAAAIAFLEAQSEAGAAAQETVTRETKRLKELVTESERRLVELRRGRRVAVAAARADRLHADDVTPVCLSAGCLEEAARALARLKVRKANLERLWLALDDIDCDTAPVSITRQLAEAGFKPSTRTTAHQILDRLGRRNKAKTGRQQPPEIVAARLQ